jgi:hypothetical protein
MPVQIPQSEKKLRVSCRARFQRELRRCHHIDQIDRSLPTYKANGRGRHSFPVVATKIGGDFGIDSRLSSESARGKANSACGPPF